MVTFSIDQLLQNRCYIHTEVTLEIKTITFTLNDVCALSLPLVQIIKIFVIIKFIYDAQILLFHMCFKTNVENVPIFINSDAD